jgi:hypothetical protein
MVPPPSCQSARYTNTIEYRSEKDKSCEGIDTSCETAGVYGQTDGWVGKPRTDGGMAVCETFTKGNRFIVGILFKIFIDPSIPDKHGTATILVSSLQV